MLKKMMCLLLVLAMMFMLCACNKEEIREKTKSILKDVFRALPGGLKEAKEKVVDPAIDDLKNDAKEIYEDVKPSWEEAFPHTVDNANDSTQ